MLDRELPRGIGFWHPVCLVGSWFGAGFLPPAPGTWGSLFALPFAWVMLDRLGWEALLAAACVVFLLGWWAAEVFVQRTRGPDPQQVVVDEVVGQWLVLVAAPLDPWYFALGFVLFRAADIIKPWPASWADRKLSGGLAVMLDDVFAVPYALGLLWSLEAVVEAVP